ncbi:hypothetical protein [Staphylococcus equorum]|uniref:hypothetical protein n=1 Tax=Staphylococcus equorum TaxID=246432 RepID=UPI002556D343|nr:hypothetical protein [Staphylococcus equorum]MDK9870041.1 hypothetical protein [Staphylococcus equorum]
MNELQQQEFDYSLVDTATVTKLEEYEKQLNRIYNSYSIEVGEVLYNAHEELSNYGDGTFIKWAESKGIKKASVYNYINAYKFVQQLDKPEEKETFLTQPKRLQYAMSKPSANKEVNQAVLDGEVKSSKEYKELEKQLKQRDEEKSQLESQLSQAQRSESIALKQLEDAEDKEPEVIERYMEPEDYQSIKNMNEHLQSEREYYKKQADGFREEVKSIMNQPNADVEFTEDEVKEDYTPVLIQLLKPAEEFIKNYNHHLNNDVAQNELEKIIKMLKEK